MRYFIHLSFDGTNYRGWQRQKNSTSTVQETIENTLSKLFKKKISVYGCGRTDAGVHASQYVIQTYTKEAPLFDLKFRLNKNLPNDISIIDVIQVNENQHCRYDVVERTYDYFLHWNKNALLNRYSSFYEGINLDFELMKKAAELILKTKDFKALCKQPNSYNNTHCTITNCEIFVNEKQGRLRFSITGSRFLRGMVRICIFFILRVGSGKMTLEEFIKVLNQELNFKEKQPARANGLFLSKIEYPFLELNNSQNIVNTFSIGLKY